MSTTAIEYAPAYGVEIVEARIPIAEELTKFADWYRQVAIFSVFKGRRVKLQHISLTDISQILDRRATHSFPGCNNFAWILTTEEEDSILAIEAEREKAAQATIATEQQAENERRDAIIAVAKQTNTDQVLEKWMSGCDGSVRECSYDACYIMVRPDGSTYSKRHHTF